MAAGVRAHFGGWMLYHECPEYESLYEAYEAVILSAPAESIAAHSVRYY